MKNTILLLSVLMIGVFLFGCTNQGNNHNIEDNVTVQPDDNTTVQPGGLEFSVPSELPIAYVGKPYFYSICDPQPTDIEGFRTYVCGDEGVITKNPKGGTPPYAIELNTANYDNKEWSIYAMYPSKGIFNFTPQLRDAGQYVFEFCATDSGSNGQRQSVCKNTTLYVMSDTVTVKGEGELSHQLFLKLDSNVAARDFVGNAVEKNITTGYVLATNFSFAKVTAEIPAATQPCDAGVPCGGGSFAGQDVTATDTSVSVIADGSAACGNALGPDWPDDYNVDYYHVGFVGYTDNTYVALSITNTGTKEKAVDIYLEASSEVDSRSQNYFTVSASAYVGVDYENYVSVPTGARGELNVNSTVFRVLVRPGTHWMVVGNMNDRFANTNMLSCPSFVKASSKVSVTIVPADMSDGKKAIGSIYSRKDGSDFMPLGFS